MKIKKGFKYIIIFFIMSFSIFASRGSTNGVGDLKITINLSPIGTTKLYPMSDKTILDTGIYNSNDSFIQEAKVIAKVEVIMETKKGSNDDLSNNNIDPCVIDGQFNGILDYKKLKSAVESTGMQLKLKKYKGNEAIMNLKAKNYKNIGTVIHNQDPTDDMYMFTAYPGECGYDVPNMITRLAYSFDLVLEIDKFKNGDIVRGDVEITAEAGKGAVKDLVIEQINQIMTGAN